MKVNECYVLRRTLEQTDSMGGDLPFQSYFYVSSPCKRTIEVLEAAVFITKQDALDYVLWVVRDSTYKPVGLARAIQDEIQRAIDYHKIEKGDK